MLGSRMSRLVRLVVSPVGQHSRLALLPLCFFLWRAGSPNPRCLPVQALERWDSSRAWVPRGFPGTCLALFCPELTSSARFRRPRLYYQVWVWQAVSKWSHDMMMKGVWMSIIINFGSLLSDQLHTLQVYCRWLNWSTVLRVKLFGWAALKKVKTKQNPGSAVSSVKLFLKKVVLKKCSRPHSQSILNGHMTCVTTIVILTSLSLVST